MARNLLVAHPDRDYARHLIRSLQAGLPEYSFRHASTIAGARSVIRKVGFSWLIVAERFSNEERILRSPPWVEAPGVKLAQEFQELRNAGVVERRTVVITSSVWDASGVQLSRRLLAIPANRLGAGDAVELVDMINAGDEGMFLLPATVVMFDVQITNGQIVIRHGETPDGPLRPRLRSRLPDQGSELTVNISNEADIGRFLDASCAPEDRLRMVRQLAKHLGEALESAGFLTWIGAAMKEVRGFCSSGSFDSSGPFALHLHFRYEKQEALRLALDLALTEKRGDGHLCMQLPVVWRPCVSRRTDDATERDVNAVEFSAEKFVAAFSCAEQYRFQDQHHDGIPHAERHTREIMEKLGLNGSSPKPVTHPHELRKLLNEDGTQPHQAIHFTTHGRRDSVPDHSGVLVGPDKGSRYPNDTELICLGQISPDREPALRFAFFNCCDLGYQASPEESYGSIHGSFAAGVVDKAIANEVICHRWPATAHWAFMLCDKFYEVKPRTIHARAAALVRARCLVGKEIARKGAEDATYLALEQARAP